jgi:chemotaxis protein methyltransferase CheR
MSQMALLEPSVTERDYPFSRDDFERVRKFIYGRAGINLNATKENMVYSRLSRRLRATGQPSFRAYLDSLERGDSPEWQEFTNALTTNLTSFFRESHHFPILTQFIKERKGQPIRIWCSAASTGEEPYSLAITVCEAYGTLTPPATILATDIDTNVLATADRGVYKEEGLRNVSESQLRKFFMRGKGSNAGMVRVRPELRKLITFAQLNLLAQDYGLKDSYDVIFCRNVLIYFDKPTQRIVLERMGRRLDIGGLLFAGHSENINDCQEWYRPRGKTVYERVNGARPAV